jgi:FG-GAP-like repeat
MQCASRLGRYCALSSSLLLVELLTSNGFSANTLFIPAHDISVPGVQTELAARVDLNHDGNLDLVIGRRYGPSFVNGEIVVLLGKGDGTFRSPKQYPAGKVPAFAIADVNNDGNLDVVAIAGEVEVFLGNGDGTLQAPIFSAGEQGGDAFSIAAADFWWRWEG